VIGGVLAYKTDNEGYFHYAIKMYNTKFDYKCTDCRYVEGLPYNKKGGVLWKLPLFITIKSLLVFALYAI